MAFDCLCNCETLAVFCLAVWEVNPWGLEACSSTSDWQRAPQSPTCSPPSPGSYKAAAHPLTRREGEWAGCCIQGGWGSAGWSLSGTEAHRHTQLSLVAPGQSGTLVTSSPALNSDLSRNQIIWTLLQEVVYQLPYKPFPHIPMKLRTFPEVNDLQMDALNLVVLDRCLIVHLNVNLAMYTMYQCSFKKCLLQSHKMHFGSTKNKSVSD